MNEASDNLKTGAASTPSGGSAAAMMELIRRRGAYELEAMRMRGCGNHLDAKKIVIRAAALGEAIQVLQAYTEKPLPNTQISEGGPLTKQ